MNWITTSFEVVPAVLVSAVGIYVGVILLTRVAGLRSFSKLSSFDFAMTVAIGSLVATTIVSADPPLLQALVGLACLYGLQMGVAIVRRESPRVARMVDNRPLLLMDGSRLIQENLRLARVTEEDLRAKLREANVLALDQVRAVVMETTGDVSVLHGAADGPRLEPVLLEGVRGAPPD